MSAVIAKSGNDIKSLHLEFKSRTVGRQVWNCTVCNEKQNGKRMLTKIMNEQWRAGKASTKRRAGAIVDVQKERKSNCWQLVLVREINVS